MPIQVITNPRQIAEQLVKWLDEPEEMEESSADRRKQAAIDRAEERYKDR